MNGLAYHYVKWYASGRMAYRLGGHCTKTTATVSTYRFFKMAATVILDFNGQEGRTASCQISSKSLEPQPRCGDFPLFQDGGRQSHLGL